MYVTPGNLELVALTTNTGVQQWTLTMTSDYGPLNLGEFYKTNGPVFQVNIPMPNQPCRIFLTSECSDGNNVYVSTNTLLNYQRQTLVDRSVRYCQTANVNIANCNVVVDGATGPATTGDRLLLVGQTNLAQNGVYFVGALSTNNAALTRTPDYATGLVLQSTPVVEVNEGSAWAGSTWKVIGQVGAITVDTTNVNFYPRVIKGNITNLSNASNANVTSLFILSNTATIAICTATSSTNAAVQTSVVASGAGTGYVTFVPFLANANGAYIIQNW
jgi:hypothetical protein